MLNVMMRLPIAVLLAAGFPACAQTAGRTFALIIGISQYQKLPPDLWLQYPDNDATQFARFLASPRGGAVPSDQIRLLTNSQATTGAIRNAFQTFLKDKPGRSDTVYVLIAGHGTVDTSGAYILTADSDPENLLRTALPMAELHMAVEGELARAGRVILLADVCRAATIAGTKTASLGATVQALGESAGEMLGLMSARPKELSIESPDFGGGHGAFTWSLLRGLSGMADADHDGFVTAGELIDFVYGDVKKLTSDKQHPTEFGNMEDSTKLSDLSKPGIALP
jgi:uncharacterized caspase-like protein